MVLDLVVGHKSQLKFAFGLAQYDDRLSYTMSITKNDTDSMIQDILPLEIIVHITKFVDVKDIIYWKRACRKTNCATAVARPNLKYIPMDWDCAITSASRATEATEFWQIQYAKYRAIHNFSAQYKAHCFHCSSDDENNKIVSTNMCFEIRRFMDDEFLLSLAICGNHVDTVQYLIDGPYHKKQITSGALQYIVYCGSLDVLIWIHKTNRIKDEYLPRMYRNAGFFSQVSIAIYMLDQGFPGSHNMMIEAATDGCAKFIKLIHRNGCEFSAGATRAAAQYGNFDSLKYLLKRGCPADDDLCLVVSNAGHMFNVSETREMISWMHDNGYCPSANCTNDQQE